MFNAEVKSASFANCAIPLPPEGGSFSREAPVILALCWLLGIVAFDALVAWFGAMAERREPQPPHEDGP